MSDPDGLSALSDEQLLSQGRFTAAERSLGRLCMAVAAMVWLAGAAASFWLWGRLFLDFSHGTWAALLGLGVFAAGGAGGALGLFLLLALLYLVVHRGLCRRSTPFVGELVERWGQADMERYADSASVSLDSPGAPGWILLFKGASRPGGPVLWTRIELADGGGGKLESRCGQAVHRVLDGGLAASLYKRDRELTGEEAKELAEHALGFGGAGSSLVPSELTDGFPCELVALRRQPRDAIRASANLAGVPQEFRGHQAVRLMQLVIRVAGDDLIRQLAHEFALSLSPPAG
ncbi:MAG: hypothetical protein HY303_20715 [Candidatus Wallbacteria bacterium]|nr:hypothetical protein [Candidatus Wallbacteria bacterium]